MAILLYYKTPSPPPILYTIGALMSGLSNAEMIADVLGTISFNYIYSATLVIYEGIVFLIAGTMYLPCFPLLG